MTGSKEPHSDSARPLTAAESVAAWRHRLVPGQGLTLLLLHGTGGDENSLIDVAHDLVPAARLIGVAGRSTEEGVRRYFRRFSALDYDQTHLAEEADALTRFVRGASEVYGWGDEPVVAIGYSNGANLAVAMLLRNPRTLAGAALLRPVQPLASPPEADLGRTPVLALSGSDDPYGAAGAALPALLRSRGAEVEAHTVAAGHELVREDLDLLAAWLAKTPWTAHPDPDVRNVGTRHR